MNWHEQFERAWPDPDRRTEALARLHGRLTGHDPFPGRKGKRTDRTKITDTERRLLQAYASGLTMREVAHVFDLSAETVITELHRVRRVLGAKNTTHAVAIALRRGLIL